MSTAHRDAMSRYYQLQAPIYDLTRRAFLFGREQIVCDLNLKPGEVVVEVGCGTGKNFSMIRGAIGDTGELIAVDCSGAMLIQARERVTKAGWNNVQVVDREYGWSSITRGAANVVLFSYSLSMIPAWREALNCAHDELQAGGRIGIVDFYSDGNGQLARAFAQWMSWNHVHVNRPYRETLAEQFRTRMWVSHRVMSNAWCYFRYVGVAL